MDFVYGKEKRFFDFISSISEKDRVALVAHDDLDGLTSAVLISKAIGKIDYLRIRRYSFDMFKEIYEECKKKKISKIIIADLGVEEREQDFIKLARIADVLVIDHHKAIKDLNSKKIVFMKAESRFPASYLCYYLFSKITKLASWIAVLGILADMPHFYNKDNADKVYKDFSLERTENFYDSKTKLSYGLIYLEDNIKQAYTLFMNSRSISDLKELEKYGKEVEKEISFYLADFDKNKEVYNDLFYYYFKPRYRIKSLLNTFISLKYPDKTIILVRDDGEKLELSARRQDRKVDSARLLQESIK